jgi:lipopolysaccharide export system protein LptC
MKIKPSISTKSITVLSIIAMLFSCSKRLDQIQVSNKTDFLPMSIAENINTKYTDSGRLTSILVSSKMINFSNQDFPFYEFPEGIHLTLFDKKKKHQVQWCQTTPWYIMKPISLI